MLAESADTHYVGLCCAAENNTTELENVIIANERNVNLLLIYLCMSSITIRIEEDFGISLSVSLCCCACIIESGHSDCSYKYAAHRTGQITGSSQTKFISIWVSRMWEKSSSRQWRVFLEGRQGENSRFFLLRAEEEREKEAVKENDKEAAKEKKKKMWDRERKRGEEKENKIEK